MMTTADGDPTKSTEVEKVPKTKEEIERLIVAELRTFSDCEKALGVIVIAIADYTDGTSWTVSSYDCGKSDGYACDRALQRIVPQFQRVYDMVQKH